MQLTPNVATLTDRKVSRPCLCCQTLLLRQVSSHRVYWFCPSCHQEMLPARRSD